MTESSHSGRALQQLSWGRSGPAASSDGIIKSSRGIVDRPAAGLVLEAELPWDARTQAMPNPPFRSWHFRTLDCLSIADFSVFLVVQRLWCFEPGR
ncbi:hypothetical protein [Devosia elaeis]|uniref:hypothetical protein n=1 Tax=Devosia elaeis TaxID=1770058 RepID=UPI0010427BE1|nr:hypothetical protein [Devosia elaeis]